MNSELHVPKSEGHSLELGWERAVMVGSRLLRPALVRQREETLWQRNLERQTAVNQLEFGAGRLN